MVEFRREDSAPVRARPIGRAGRILVVDDNDDVRQMMAVALETQGHRVEEAAEADEALQKLRGSHFDVVLADYELPDKTGATMLREAIAAGLLDQATALIVTAHTAPDDVDGFAVIPKPVNLERLMAQVRGVLATAEPTFRPPDAADGGEPLADLVLYVAAGSSASARARHSMETVLRRFPDCAIRFTVSDVADDPAQAEEDRIVFAPTLVKRSPGPRAWVLGDLADATVVVDLLKFCGMKPSA